MAQCSASQCPLTWPYWHQGWDSFLRGGTVCLLQDGTLAFLSHPPTQSGGSADHGRELFPNVLWVGGPSSQLRTLTFVTLYNGVSFLFPPSVFLASPISTSTSPLCYWCSFCSMFKTCDTRFGFWNQKTVVHAYAG